MRVALFALFLIVNLLAESNSSKNNISKDTNVTEVIKKLKPSELNPSSQNQIESLMKKLSEIEKKSKNGNIWTKIYSSYRTYKELKNRQSWLNGEVFKLKRKENLTKEEKKLLGKELNTLQEMEFSYH